MTENLESIRRPGHVCSPRLAVSCVVPPHILQKLAESRDKTAAQVAFNTLLTTTHLRGERSIRALAGISASPDTGRRTIYDCRGSRQLTSAALARTEDSQPPSDGAVNRAFDGFGKTRDFYREILNRNSVDDRGMRLNGYVHFGTRFQNAFWDGQQMVFGDGDGEVFTDFTKSLDVIAHELTHGVTEFTANLEYHNQSGALNESISDVFGSLVKQWSKHQDVTAADWLIGAEVLTPGIAGDALRSMKAPGTAYDNDLIGKDPQPDHMNRFAQMPDTEQGDWGGVHINSGIPNKAFYLTAMAIGGFAWEAAGHIWYESLKASTETTNFQDFAETAYAKAGQIYGAGGAEQTAVASAWREVGIRVSTLGSQGTRARTPWSAGADSAAEFRRELKAMSDQIQALSRDLNRMKGYEPMPVGNGRS